MKAAILSLTVAVALAASAEPAAARPPRYSANHSVPIRTLSSLDEARYGEPLPYSAPNSAFSTYGVAYPAPANRPANGRYLTPAPGTSNIGYYGALRGGRR